MFCCVQDLVPDVGGDDEDEDDECNWVSPMTSLTHKTNICASHAPYSVLLCTSVFLRLDV